ncbi:MAG: hypothetical protein CMP34_00640 [Rickettsiales bacterium]|nr:hypothetical protein [Rickettsiales bacterium]|tara:strand:+ start:3790 stop:4218 length:429 start_codon:yes stop_codon:yes gene_type:complete
MEVKTFHATSVVIDSFGLMILGPTGIGKSDLALRLIDNGATLITDDITICKKVNNKVLLFSPNKTKGLLEVREVGIINVPYVENINLVMIIDLLKTNNKRIPERKFKKIFGLKFPVLSLNGKTPSSVIKVKVKLNEITEFKK